MREGFSLSSAPQYQGGNLRMKKIAMTFFILSVLLIALCACATLAQGPDDLDIAIRDTSDYLNDNIPQGNKIVILNIQSDYANLSDYIIDELIANAVNDKVFSVVDRAQLETIRMELNFQLSGEVSDDSALSIGRFLGAQTIVSGTISEIGDRYRMRIRALNVETAQVQGQYNRNIAVSKTMTALMRGGRSRNASYGTASASGSRSSGTQPSSDSTASGTAQTRTTPTRTVYRIGDTGPAGGLVFYDKGNNIGGWRYMEAAPVDLGPSPFIAGSPPDSLPRNLKELWDRTEGEGGRGIGKGKYNSEYLMEIAQARGGFNWAVRLCDNYELNGFDDWFLPSRDELNFVYGNLYLQGRGNFRQEQYWSSTTWTDTWGSYRAWYVNFNDGQHDNQNAGQQRRCRPVRQF
jgi:TolB-like protein